MLRRIASTRRSAAVLAGCLLIGAGILLAKASMTTFTAVETMGAMIPGKETFPGGNYHARGWIIPFAWAASDSRATIAGEVVLNANFGKDGSGPMWGTLQAGNSGGTWEGSWTGVYGGITAQGETMEYEATLHGGGGYEDLQIKVHCVYAQSWTGTCTGRILDTPSK